MNKAVFLDRDGTINAEKGYIYKIQDFEFLPNTIDALRLLQDNGFKLIIITNQSGIGRGYYTEKDFELLNTWMVKELMSLGVRIDKVYYCPHLPDAKVEIYRQECECRKPKLGMFFQAISDFELDVSKCYAIGDKIRDCSICTDTKCKGYLVGKNEDSDIINMVKKGFFPQTKYAESLFGATKQILLS